MYFLPQSHHLCFQVLLTILEGFQVSPNGTQMVENDVVCIISHIFNIAPFRYDLVA